MKILTIPKSMSNQGELVVLPRRDYEQLVADSAKESAKRDPKVDRELALALADVKKGLVYGPFLTAAEGISFLRNRRRQARKK